MNHLLKVIKRVVIWGYPKDTHTHSYIHEAFYRAFCYLGYETFWFNNSTNVSNFDFSNTLFLTSGDVESEKIPVRKDCLYILHNVPGKNFGDIRDNIVVIQVFGKRIPAIKNIVKINAYTYIEDKTIYLPWATNLLPHEIDVNIIIRKDSKEVNYVGTVADSGYSNVQVPLNKFSIGCAEDSIKVFVYGGYTPGGKAFNIENRPGFVSNERHINLIRSSAYAPQFCGDFQLDIGYLPCRIFKNISYGHHGLTNSSFVNDMFNGELIYDEDGYTLYTKARSQLPSNKTRSLIQLVRDKHTFVNRIETILEFFK